MQIKTLREGTRFTLPPFEKAYRITSIMVHLVESTERTHTFITYEELGSKVEDPQEMMEVTLTVFREMVLVEGLQNAAMITALLLALRADRGV